MTSVFSALAAILTLHGLPLFAALGAFALIFQYSLLVKENTPSAEIISQMTQVIIDPLDNLTGNDLLLPIPLFTVTGYIIARSGAANRILRVFTALSLKAGIRNPAGIGILALVLCAFFTPLTGASGVTIVALGGLLFPLLKNAGYEDKNALGVITAGGSLGLLFFPSLPVILYGIFSMNKAPIDKLFIAGIIPGVLLIAIPSLYLVFRFRGNAHALPLLPYEGNIRTDLLKLMFEVSIIPVCLFLFLSGKVTVSELGAIFLLHFVFFEILMFREIPLRNLPGILEEALSLLGGILIIVFFAFAFTRILIYDQLPQKLFELLQSYISSKYAFLMLLNVFLLVVGALMDIFSAIVVVAPLVIPIAEFYGINMIHLGILFLTNLEIGYLTPPVGINLFISSLRFKKPIPEVYSSVIPFLLCLLGAQVLITYLPAISLLWF